jgi:hypothetical protein
MLSKKNGAAESAAPFLLFVVNQVFLAFLAVRKKVSGERLAPHPSSLIPPPSSLIPK